MFKTILAFAFSLTIATAFWSGAMAAESQRLVRVESPYPVDETVDKLVAVAERAGARVFARIDHAAGAESIGTLIPANVLVVLGNPRLGTPLIAEIPEVGLDLPLRILVKQQGSGSVLVYRSAIELAAMHGLQQDNPVIMQMETVLARLSNGAVRYTNLKK